MMTNLFRHAAVCACAVFTISSAAVGAAAPAPVASAGTVNPSLFADMHWRLIGPFRGGRALAVTGVPGSPTQFYFGAVAGGVLLGVVLSYAGGYLGSNLVLVYGLAVLVLVLMIRPSGLFSAATARRV